MSIVYARMRQKQDTADNWSEVEDYFAPGPGELIIYYKDEEDFQKPRIRIGDGVSPLKSLDFLAGEVYCQSEEPEEAGENAVWITPDSDQMMQEYVGLKPKKITVSKTSSNEILLSTELENGIIITDIVEIDDTGTPYEVQVDGSTIEIIWQGFNEENG